MQEIKERQAFAALLSSSSSAAAASRGVEDPTAQSSSSQASAEWPEGVTLAEGLLQLLCVHWESLKLRVRRVCMCLEELCVR